MVIKTNIPQKNRVRILLTAVGSWAMMLATLIGSLQISRTSREPVVVNTVRPVYSYVNAGFDDWNRNDTENETVHLPTKFDVGLHITAVTGRK